MFRKILSIIALVLFTSACSHIPLSTMVSMSSFDAEDFIALDPADIRVKVRTNQPLSLDGQHVKLKFLIGGPAIKTDGSLSLIKLKHSVRTINNWFSEDTKEYITVYALSEDSIQIFKNTQKTKAVRTSMEDSTFNFKTTINFPEDSPRQISFSIDLLLEPEEGYFTLFDDVYIDFDEAKRSQENNSE